MPKISVIVPVYNVERFLPNCIESLMAQTLDDIEFILVDDGSTDRSGEICDRYALADPRIRVIHQPNRGVSAARNAGLDAASNPEYIGFVDPDDWIDPEMYEKMAEAFDSTDADLVACGYDYYDEECNIDKNRLYKSRPDEVLTRENLFLRLSDMPPTIRHGVWSKAFRFRTCLQSGIRFDESLHSSEDLDFLMRYIENVNKTVFIHQPLYKNTVRQGSATHGGLNIPSLRDSFRVHERMYRDTVKNFPTQKNYAIAFLLDVCTLKYNEAKRKASSPTSEEAKCLSQMRSFIRRMAIKAIPSRHIYWKTRLSYLLLWIRK